MNATERRFYLLGIIDGEGSISIHKNTKDNTTKIRVSVQMGSEEIRHLLSREWGGNVVSVRERTRRPHHRRMWHWSVSGKGAIELLRFMSVHSIEKRQHAIVGLKFALTVGRGWLKLTEEVKAIREAAEKEMKVLNNRATG